MSLESQTKLEELRGKLYACVSFRLVDIHVNDRARNLLRRRHKLPCGTSRFSYKELHREYGILEVRHSLRLHAFA